MLILLLFYGGNDDDDVSHNDTKQAITIRKCDTSLDWCYAFWWLLRLFLLLFDAKDENDVS